MTNDLLSQRPQRNAQLVPLNITVPTTEIVPTPFSTGMKADLREETPFERYCGLHPEARRNEQNISVERCIGNFTEEEFAQITSPTKRLGNQAYNAEGEKIEDATLHPVFVALHEQYH